MADGAHPRFDPRFDPAFQRGYDERAEDGAPAGGGRSPRVRSARPVVPVARPAVERRADPAGLADDPAGEPGGLAARGRELLDRVAQDYYQEDDSAPGLNPYLIAALVLAGLLIAAGLLLFALLPGWRMSVQQGAAMDFATIELLYRTAPLFLALGIGTVLAALLIGAARWRGARRPRRVDE